MSPPIFITISRGDPHLRSHVLPSFAVSQLKRIIQLQNSRNKVGNVNFVTYNDINYQEGLFSPHRPLSLIKGLMQALTFLG
jgi:hypothetical protein